MAVAFRAAGTWVFNANNVPTTNSLTPTKHASTVSGDCMILITESRTIAGSAATPTGWNLISGFPKTSGTASGGRVYVWTRIADGGANDAPTVTWTGHTTGTSGDTSGAGILSYSGLTETLDGTVASSDLAAQTNTSVIPAFTTGSDGSLVIGVAFKIGAESGTSTVATFTERADAVTTNGTGHLVAVSEKIQSPAGSSGTATVTWSLATSLRVYAVSFGLDAITTAPANVTNLDAAATSSTSLALAVPQELALSADAASTASLVLSAPALITATADGTSTATLDLTAPATAQILLPSADSVDGGWTNSDGGTTLYTYVSDASDATEIRSPADPVNEACRIKLAAGVTPDAGARTLTTRYEREGTSGPVDLTITLRQGGGNVLGAGVQVNQFVHSGLPDSLTSVEDTVTGSITNYADLYIELEAN